MIKGLYTVVVTPFDEKGEIDEVGFRQNIRYQIQHQVDGIVVLGTTGESPTLSHSEQERVIRIAKEELNDSQIPLMVGTGSYSTKQAIENTMRAKQLGADSVLVVSPYYNKPTPEGLYQHYAAIAKAASIPIMIYSVQGRTGQNISVDTLKRLADIPQVAGVKEASGNLLQIGEVIELIGRQRPDFSIMSGDDSLTFSVMALGGHGVLSVVSNLIPKPIKEMIRLMNERDYEAARELHYQWMPLFRGAFIETNPIPIKAVMRMCGMAAGRCRLPLCDLSIENERKLQQLLKQLTLA